jgi:hypothetical protein
MLLDQKELIIYAVTDRSATSPSVCLLYSSDMQLSFLGGIILSSVGRPAVPYFSTVSQKCRNFRKNLLNIKCRF